MTEHEDRGAHEAKADELERELDDMKERSEGLGGDIEDAGEDWERRKADESVPGATDELDGDAGDDDDDGDGTDADELDFGRDVGDAVVAEDGPPADEDDSDDSDDSDSEDSDDSDGDESS